MRTDKKQAIKNLQTYLRQLSYTDKAIPSLPVDGIFGAATKNALIAFQKENGLPQSGRADKETWDLLYKEYVKSVARNTPPLCLNVFPRVPDGYEFSLNDRCFAVSIIQVILNELRIIYDTLTPLEVSGIYSEETEKNIAEFQRLNMLKVSGDTDLFTWNALVTSFNHYVYDYI